MITDQMILLKELKKLGIDHVIRHEFNKGYGGNQKLVTIRFRIKDIMLVLHPDYQYTSPTH